MGLVPFLRDALPFCHVRTQQKGSDSEEGALTQPHRHPDRSVLDTGIGERINGGMGQRFQSPEEKQTHVNGFSKEGDANSMSTVPAGKQEPVMLWLAAGAVPPAPPPFPPQPPAQLPCRNKGVELPELLRFQENQKPEICE